MTAIFESADFTSNIHPNLLNKFEYLISLYNSSPRIQVGISECCATPACPDVHIGLKLRRILVLENNLPNPFLGASPTLASARCTRPPSLAKHLRRRQISPTRPSPLRGASGRPASRNISEGGKSKGFGEGRGRAGFGEGMIGLDSGRVSQRDGSGCD